MAIKKEPTLILTKNGVTSQLVTTNQVRDLITEQVNERLGTNNSSDFISINGGTINNELKISAGTEKNGDLTVANSTQLNKIKGTKILTYSDIKGNGDTNTVSETGANAILPDGNVVFGDVNNRFKAIYADEIHAGANTLYINGTPVLGSETGTSKTITVKADPGETLAVKTLGEGVTQISSEKSIQMNATGASNTIEVNATGTNSSIMFTANNNISMAGTTISLGKTDKSTKTTIYGETTIQDLTVTGTKTEVNTTQMNVSDVFITLNKGESGSGISHTGKQAGLMVDRGTAARYLIVFDENDDKFKVGTQEKLQPIASQNFVDRYSVKLPTMKEEAKDKIIAIGATTKGIYVNEDGVATATLYSVETDVPSNAKFTDTITTVTTTSTGNVITGISATDGQITATLGNVDVSSKADKATTLAGYGITDTYTKTDLTNKLVDVNTADSVTTATIGNAFILKKLTDGNVTISY